MSLKLTDDDRRAVDLLLDQGLSAEASGSGRTGFVAPTIDSVRLRLRKASDLLGALHLLPVGEPPADLVARTLRFVERSTADATVPAASVYSPAQSDLYGLDGPVA